MGKAYIPLGTSSKCSMGTSENLLNLPKDHGVTYAPAGQPILNANDHIPTQHILTYGLCKAKYFLPCMPVTPLAWIDVNKQHIIDGAPALLDCSKLPCMFGGVISIVPPETGSVAAGKLNKAVEDFVETRVESE